jgi:hypothetical protein
MKAIAGAVGGMLIGAGAGWVLPPLFFSGAQGDEALGLLALQALVSGLAGFAGLIVGGAWAMGRFYRTPRE